MFQSALAAAKWFCRSVVTIIVWLAKKSFWWVELDPAEDKAFRSALLLAPTDDDAWEAVGALLGSSCPSRRAAKPLFEALETEFPADEHGPAGDKWVHLMTRLNGKRTKETNEERKSQIRAAMNLLYAFHRDEETAKHVALGANSAESIGARYIKSSSDYCGRQFDRFKTGVSWFPLWQKGVKLGFWEAIGFYLCLVGIILVNGFTEPISYSFEEYIGIARNGVQRPRTIYQILVALFSFIFTDGPFLWEVGRQRTLGASLSFILFSISYFFRFLYRNKAFIISAGISATLCQITVQLGDLVWRAGECLRAGKELRPRLSWFMYILRWLVGRIPQGSDEDRNTYELLKRLNARSAAWAITYRKSKSMSVLWILFARNRAMPRDVYAARVGIRAMPVFNLAFAKKIALPIVTLGIWGLTAYALWGQWFYFTIIMAFHTVAFIKGLELAFSPEQEVQSASSVFCNMVGTATPTLFGVLIPAARYRDTYLRKAQQLAYVMPPVFFVTQWTDVFTDGMFAGLTWISKKKAARRKRIALRPGAGGTADRPASSAA